MFAQSLALFLFFSRSILELETLTKVSLYLLWLALALAMISGGKQIYDAAKGRKSSLGLAAAAQIRSFGPRYVACVDCCTESDKLRYPMPHGPAARLKTNV